jgi:hypothetical protein
MLFPAGRAAVGGSRLKQTAPLPWSFNMKYYQEKIQLLTEAGVQNSIEKRQKGRKQGWL